ncbi:FAD:protein FMN transferase ApbE [Leucothrix pacifica]|uniref:FAD:protein FMN transferase n=2 Tax=Leucothrix pacifica TaxID=1247513 RepID=A0A317CLQ7_9GAMM|nr:FAD:protein FMN transferase ApbE [Leucothrix pacifica]
MNKSSLLNFKSVLAMTAVALLALQLSACSKPVEAVKISGPTMGTSYNITLFPAKGVELDSQSMQKSIDESLKAINQQMSTWIKDSEISLFNQSQSTDWYPVSAEFAEVTAAAQEISKKSGGAFDVTVGPLIRMWGFGKDFTNNNPDQASIDEAKQNIGYQKLDVRLSPPALRKQIPQLQINLSAIAKGYAVDAIAELVAGMNVSSYLVEIGGEIRANGVKVNGDLWRIAIEKPSTKERSIQQGILLKDTGVATSGDYRNYVERDGKRYSHTIDPSTGKPITHQLASITIMNDSAMIADGFATAIMVLGEDKGKAFIAENQLKAYMITRDKDGFSTWNNFPDETFIKP